MRISDWSSDVCSSDLLRRGFVTEQFGGGEGLALGLEDAASVDRAALADAAVGRHQQGARIGVGDAYAGLQRAGKEGVEGGIGSRVGIGGFRKDDAELDRKSVVEGKRMTVRVDIGGRRVINK